VSNCGHLLLLVICTRNSNYRRRVSMTCDVHKGQCPAYLSAAVKLVVKVCDQLPLQTTSFLNFRRSSTRDASPTPVRPHGTVYQNTSAISHHMLLSSDKLKRFYFSRTILICSYILALSDICNAPTFLSVVIGAL